MHGGRCRKDRASTIRNCARQAKGREDVELDVELVIDDEAIIDRLAAKAYHNKSGSSSYMQGAVVISAKLASQSKGLAPFTCFISYHGFRQAEGVHPSGS